MDLAILEIRLSGKDILSFIEQRLTSAGIEFQDICGDEERCTIFVQVKKRQRSELEQGFEILDVANALINYRSVGKVNQTWTSIQSLCTLRRRRA